MKTARIAASGLCTPLWCMHQTLTMTIETIICTLLHMTVRRAGWTTTAAGIFNIRSTSDIAARSASGTPLSRRRSHRSHRVRMLPSYRIPAVTSRLSCDVNTRGLRTKCLRKEESRGGTIREHTQRWTLPVLQPSTSGPQRLRLKPSECPHQ